MWIQRALTPRIMYLCPRGEVSMDTWVDAKVMASNQKNIARKMCAGKPGKGLPSELLLG